VSGAPVTTYIDRATQQTNEKYWLFDAMRLRAQRVVVDLPDTFSEKAEERTAVSEGLPQGPNFRGNIL
jgi:hypothetical protein